MKLLDLLRKPAAKATSAETEAALRKAEAALASAEQDLATAEAAYRASLLDADPRASVTARERVTAAEVERDRARALMEALTDRLTATREREAEAARSQVYQDALRKVEDTSAKLTDRYPALARELVSLMGEMGEALLAVQQANDDLPAGTEPIEPPSILTRSYPRLPEQIISQRTVDLWAFPETGNVYGDQAKAEQGQGLISTGRESSKRLVKRRFREITYLPEQGPTWGGLLPSLIRLPGLLPGTPDFWSRDVSRPEAVVQAANECLAATATKQKQLPAGPQRETCVRHEPIARAVDEAAA